MKKHFASLLSILVFFSSCSPYVSPVLNEPTESISFTLESTKAVGPTTESKSETVLLDFALSPDGTKLAIYLNTGIFLYDVETLDYIALEEFKSHEYYSQLNSPGEYYPSLSAPGAVAFSPDGSQIAISGKFQDELIHIWDWKANTSLKIVADYPNGNFVRELDFSPNSNALLVRSTYPLSMLHCENTEDSLTLISLNPPSDFITKKLFEIQSCKYAPIEFHFTDSNHLYLVQVSESNKYWVYDIDIQTGNILQFDEYDVNVNGKIYDFSQNGKLIAVREYPIEELVITKLLDLKTKNILMAISGQIILLKDENRFLVYTSNNQLQLQEKNNVLCKFDELEYLRMKVSRNKNIIAVITRDKSIQIWDIPSCKLVKAIPFG